MGKNLAGKDIGRGFSQRKDGRYQGRFTKKNKIRECLYDTNIVRLKRRVKCAIEKDERDYIEGKGEYCTTEVDNNLFGDMFIKWVNDVKVYEVNAQTINNYHDKYEKHLSDFSKMPIADFTVSLCLTRINSIRSDYSYNAASVCLAIFNGIFNYAILNQIIQFSPSSPIKLKYIRKKKVEYLSPNDDDILLREIENEDYKDIIILAIHTGLRAGELLGLKKEDVDMDKHLINLNHQVRYIKTDRAYEFVFAEPKYGSKRLIPLDSVARKIVKKHFDNRSVINTLGLLFFNSKGEPYKTYCLDMYLSKKLENINGRSNNNLSVDRLSMHVFRHTFATRCLEAGMNTRVIQYLLGHKKDVMTQQYAHITHKKISEDFELINTIYKQV